MFLDLVHFNLGEVIDGITAQIDNPAITIDGLMEHIKGPDFPSGCQICGLDPIRQYLTTGRGSLRIRGRVEVETTKTGKEQIIINEYAKNVSRYISQGFLCQRKYHPD